MCDKVALGEARVFRAVSLNQDHPADANPFGCSDEKLAAEVLYRLRRTD